MSYHNNTFFNRNNSGNFDENLLGLNSYNNSSNDITANFGSKITSGRDFGNVQSYKNIMNPLDDVTRKVDLTVSGEGILKSDALNNKEIQYLNNMNKAIGEDFKGVVIHQNHSVDNDHINEPIRGAVYKYGKKTPPHPNIFNGKLFCFTGISEIKYRKDVNDAYFKKRMEVLNTIPRTSNDVDGETLSLNIYSGKYEDSVPWEATLGDDGCVLISSKRGSQGQNVYFIEVESNAGKAAQDLRVMLAKKLHKSQDNMTLDDFKTSKEYKFVENLSERNVRRLILLTANLLGVELVKIPVDDIRAVTIDPRIPRPLLAKPDVINESNCLENICNVPINIGTTLEGNYGNDYVDNEDDKNHLAYYSYVTPTDKARGGLIQKSDYLKRRVYLLNPNSSIRSGIENSKGNSFPCFTGINTDFNANNPQQINEQVADFINKTITWSQKDKNDPLNPKVLGKYKPFSEETDHINEELGANNGHIDLETVISCVPHPFN
jgi:hypothetical protein